MISKILDKLGIRSIDELNPEERKVFEHWSAILAKPDVSMDDLRRILPEELAKAREEQNDYANSEKKDLFFKAYIRVLELLTRVITTPAAQRENLKAELAKRFGIE